MNSLILLSLLVTAVAGKSARLKFVVHGRWNTGILSAVFCLFFSFFSDVTAHLTSFYHQRPNE